MNGVIVKRPDFNYESKPTEHLCADNGYYGDPAREIIVLHGYIPHVVSRGDEKRALEDNPVFKARRWVVERVFSWLNNFRKLLVRYEKLGVNYYGLLQLACAFVAFRQINVI